MSQRRRGVALLAVLAALVLLGALAAGVALEALRLQRASRRAVAGHAATVAVETAVHERIDSWPVNAAWLARGEEWSDGARQVRVLETPLAIDVAIVRLSATTYRVVASAVASNDDGVVAARRNAGRVVRLRAPPIALEAAVLAFDEPALADPAVHGFSISGRDTLVAGWECDPADSASVAGLVAPELAMPEPPPDAIEGAPALLALREDPLRALAAALDAELAAARDFAGESGARAAAVQLHDASLHAPFIAPALDTNGSCDGAAPLNWGDPLRLTPCADARPLVWIRGSLSQPRGRSQGVLVVEGDLELGGGFTHHGLVVVRGLIRRTAMPSADADAILGALVLLHPSPAEHDMRSVRVRWSSCVVRAALRAIGTAAPAAGGWREGW